MTNNTNNSGRFFLAGLAAGAALAVLFTPHSGAATRRGIASRAAEGKEMLKSTLADGQEYVRSHGEALRKRVKEVAREIASDESPQTEV